MFVNGARIHADSARGQTGDKEEEKKEGVRDASKKIIEKETHVKRQGDRPQSMGRYLEGLRDGPPKKLR